MIGNFWSDVSRRNLESDSALKGTRRISKAYLAIVIGVVDTDEFVIDKPMRAMPESVSSCMMEVGGEGAVPAVTEVTVISRGRQFTLVEARPRQAGNTKFVFISPLLTPDY